MLALHKLDGQRTGKNKHYVWERIGAQLLQILHRQKKLVVTLPLCDLKQPVNVVQSCLLHQVDQLASIAPAYEPLRKQRQVNRENRLDKYELHQN